MNAKNEYQSNLIFNKIKNYFNIVGEIWFEE